MPTTAQTNKGGRPLKVENAQKLLDEFRSYVEHCKDIDYMPNIAGFCRYLDINRDTYYEYKNRYSDTVKKIEGILEDEALNSKAVNDTLKIFYMKNKFSEDYKDRQEFMVTERNYEVEG